MPEIIKPYVVSVHGDYIQGTYPSTLFRSMTRKDPNAQQKEENSFLGDVLTNAGNSAAGDVIKEINGETIDVLTGGLKRAGTAGRVSAAVIKYGADAIQDAFLDESRELIQDNEGTTAGELLEDLAEGGFEGAAIGGIVGVLTGGTGFIAGALTLVLGAISGAVKDRLSKGGPAAVVESYAKPKPKPEDESGSMKQVLDQELARQDRERQEDAAQSRVQRIEAYAAQQPNGEGEVNEVTATPNRDGNKWKYSSEQQMTEIADSTDPETFGWERDTWAQEVDSEGNPTGRWMRTTVQIYKGEVVSKETIYFKDGDDDGDGVPNSEDDDYEPNDDDTEGNGTGNESGGEPDGEPDGEPKDPEEEEPQDDDAEPDPDEERPNPANEDQGDADSNAENPLKDIDADIDWDPDNDGNSDPVTGYEGLEGWNGRIDPRPLDELNGGDGETRFDYLIDFDGTIDDGPDGRPNQDRDQEVVYGWLEDIEPRTIGDTIQSPMAEGNLTIAGINLNLDDQELNLAAVTGDI